MNSLISTALALAKRCRAVFPCHPRTKLPLGKLVPHGCLEASTDPETIRVWWQQQPAANIGMATGHPSGVWVLDIDGVDGEASLREMEAANTPLPPTVEVITGNHGRHVFFRQNGITVRNTAKQLGAGLDVRGDGGYVIAPPSVHPNGRTYEWSVDSAPLADAPAWLLDLVIDRPAASGAPFPIRPDHWLEKMQNGGIPDGSRSAFLTSKVGKYIRHGLGGLEPYFIIRALNLTYCNPPVDEEEVLRIAASICSCDTRRRIRET